MKNLKPKELEKGKVYFLEFTEVCTLIARFKKKTTTECRFYSEIKTWDKKETFYKNSYCSRACITELRAATEAETAKLVKYEAENDVQHILSTLGKEPTQTPLTAERLPDDFRKSKVYEGTYKKELTKSLEVGVCFDERNADCYIFLGRIGYDNELEIWAGCNEFTENRLAQIYEMFHRSKIEFKELEVEEPKSELEELQDYVISLEKRIIKLEFNA